ncbi:hypothetical protein HYT55_05320 [Candidatus Woesearchaeota archaeon]|nr:hypothetical protein [Candidatus Woesearchaeota archaeon]
MGLIGAGRKLVLNTLSALALAWSGSLGSCSPGTVQHDYICEGSDCHPISQEEKEKNGIYSDHTLSPLEITITSSTGETTLHNQDVLVTDEYDYPLANITVYGLQNGHSTLFLATDPNGIHYSSFQVQSRSTRQGYLKTDQAGKFSQQEGNLQEEDLLTLVMRKYQWGKEIISTLTSTQGELLSEQDNVRTYCLTIEQMKNNYLLIPAGILVLASPDGISAKVLKFAQGAFVNEVFNTYIRVMYGEQEGYRISVPLETTNLCGSDDGAVCIISTESLSKQIWSKQEIPYWEIHGSCTPSLLGQYKE